MFKIKTGYFKKLLLILVILSLTYNVVPFALQEDSLQTKKILQNLKIKLPVFLLPEIDIKNGNGIKAVFLKTTFYNPFNKTILINETNYFKDIKSQYRVDKKNFLNPDNFKLFLKLKNQFIIKSEITVIFEDEDFPQPFTDLIYDIFRQFKYNRKDDVETFFVYYKVNKYKNIDTKDNKANTHSNLSKYIEPVLVYFPDTFSFNQTFFDKNITHYRALIDIKDFILINGRPLIYINTWNHLFSNKNNNKNIQLHCYSRYPVFEGTRDFVESTYK